MRVRALVCDLWGVPLRTDDMITGGPIPLVDPTAGGASAAVSSGIGSQVATPVYENPLLVAAAEADAKRIAAAPLLSRDAVYRRSLALADVLAAIAAIVF